MTKRNGNVAPGSRVMSGVVERARPRPPRAAEDGDRLDPMIHEQMRLGIVSALAVNRVLSFTDLKQLLKTSDGNLSVHARKLEEADYIRCSKSFSGRLPKTEYRLSALGKRALDRYLDRMEALIHSARTR